MDAKCEVLLILVSSGNTFNQIKHHYELCDNTSLQFSSIIISLISLFNIQLQPNYFKVLWPNHYLTLSSVSISCSSWRIIIWLFIRVNSWYQRASANMADFLVFHNSRAKVTVYAGLIIYRLSQFREICFCEETTVSKVSSWLTGVTQCRS